MVENILDDCAGVTIWHDAVEGVAARGVSCDIRMKDPVLFAFIARVVTIFSSVIFRFQRFIYAFDLIGNLVFLPVSLASLHIDNLGVELFFIRACETDNATMLIY